MQICRVFLDHSLDHTPGRNAPDPASLRSRQGRCPCVPAGKPSHELMEICGELGSRFISLSGKRNKSIKFTR